jgi:hypothetical protein
MKKLLFTFLIFAAIQPLFSQITPAGSYNHSGTYVWLANSGTKFYIMDVTANQAVIYNLDQSPWKTINLSVPADHYLYDIRYPAEGLFTTGSEVALCYIYYKYDEVNQYYTYTAKIVTETGTPLLTIPGAQYVYIFDLGEPGVKMIAYVYDYSVWPYTIETKIYDLPGDYVPVAEHQPQGQTFADAFPNPATDFAIVPCTLPEGIANATLKLHDHTGQLIIELPVHAGANHVQVNTAQLPSGIYFYSIIAEGYNTPARKLVVK